MARHTLGNQGTEVDTSTSNDERWQVKLEIFEGPLDLLLHLVRKEEMDIRDVPIATIADEYLKYLDLLKELDLNVAGEFLLMAASLVYLKSRVLIPRELLQHVEDGESDEEDPEELFYRELEEWLSTITRLLSAPHSENTLLGGVTQSQDREVLALNLQYRHSRHRVSPNEFRIDSIMAR